MNMDSYTFRSNVKKYTEEAIKDLEEVKKINDIGQQCNKVSFDVRKHKRNLEELKQGKPEEISYYENYFPFNLDKYEKKVKELDYYWGEVAQKSNEIRTQKQKEQQNKENQLKTSHCAYCKNNPPTNHYIYSKKNKILKPRKRNASLFNEWLFCSEAHFEKWHKKNYFCCGECNKESWDGKYKRSKSKKDGQKFCSDNCYYTHYAETCDNCYDKCLKYSSGKATGHAQTYYSDGINKTGILCSKCHQVQLKEEREEKKKDQEWEDNSKRLSKNMDDLVEGMVEAVGNNDNDNKKIDNKDNNPISIERERERERESNLTQQQQLLTEIMNLEQNPTNPKNQAELVTKKKKLTELETKQKELTNSLPLTTQITILEQEIKELENKSTRTKVEEALLTSKKKELAELLRKQQSANTNTAKSSDKTAFYVGCGVIGLSALLLIFILARNRQKRKLKEAVSN